MFTPRRRRESRPISPSTADIVALLFGAGEQGLLYDPSNFATIFQDSGGTVPVTAAGQPVGRILDQSGRGNFATFANVTLQQDGAGRYYLSANGTSSTGATNPIDFTATNKITVFAGVQRASDAASAMLVELSAASSGANPGAFGLFSPSGAAANHAFQSCGTAAQSIAVVTGAAPILSVLTGIGDIAAPAVILRRNGVPSATVSASQGTGNYGNYQMFIGARAGTSLFFSGRLYSLIVRGAASSAPQIASGESYVNSKTGAF